MTLLSIEFVSFDKLEPEISWVKGVLGTQTGGTPPGAFWRPLGTWRRVLRTMRVHIENESFDELEPEIS